MAEVSQTSAKPANRPAPPSASPPNPVFPEPVAHTPVRSVAPRRNETAAIIKAWIQRNQTAAVLGALALGVFIGVMMRR